MIIFHTSDHNSPQQHHLGLNEFTALFTYRLTFQWPLMDDGIDGGVAAGELSDDNDGRGLTYDTHNRITTKLMG